MADAGEKPQLRMIWPPERFGEMTDTTPPPGYTIRTYQPGDELVFLALMAEGGFDPWDDQRRISR